MNDNPGAGSGNGAAGSSNSSSLSRRESRELREARANTNLNGAHPTLGADRGYSSGSYDFDNLISTLRELFEQDRQIASQPDSTRCGICYLYFKVDELSYREEGFYICKGCAQALGTHPLPMLRKQQK